MLPVIAELVGRKATAQLLSFRLADYARINGVPPPCFVGAALGVFRPAGSDAARIWPSGQTTPSTGGLRAC
jgi:hypothetical protein